MEEIKMAEIINDVELTEVSGGTYVGKVFKYTIRRGDCLSVLAERYHTTVATLVELNNIPNPNLIYEGHTLLIPYNG